MNVRKFVATSAGDALRKVKELLGPDAIILSNRATADGVEIMAVAAGDMETMLPPETRETAKPAPLPEEEDYVVSLSGSLGSSAASARMPPPRQASIPVPASIPAPRKAPLPPLAPRPMPRIERPAPRQAEIVPAEVMNELRTLRKLVEQHLAGLAWGEAARSEPVKTDILRQMLDTGFSPKLARELLEALPKELDAAKALAWVKAATSRVLRCIDEENDIINRGGIYALVGPTGVGKTTTTAKLAARCVLRHGASRVALITTDSYRIGAHEQLRIYGRILGVPVYLVKDADDLRQTLMSLAHKHMVLIDTIGMSQRDKMAEEQMALFGNGVVKRLLLLAATVRGDTLDDVVRVYSGPDLAGCILSKVDEAAGLACSLDVIIRHRLLLHYVSNGQRVPEDLHLPKSSYLLHRAFKDLPEASPHRLEAIEPQLMMSAAGLAFGGARG